MISHRISLAAICLLATPLIAQQPTSIRPLTPKARSETPSSAPTTPAAVRGVRDRAELEAFVDGIMVANLRDKHVAGATVAFGGITVMGPTRTAEAYKRELTFLGTARRKVEMGTLGAARLPARRERALLRAAGRRAHW